MIRESRTSKASDIAAMSSAQSTGGRKSGKNQPSRRVEAVKLGANGDLYTENPLRQHSASDGEVMDTNSSAPRALEGKKPRRPYSQSVGHHSTSGADVENPTFQLRAARDPQTSTDRKEPLSKPETKSGATVTTAAESDYARSTKWAASFRQLLALLTVLYPVSCNAVFGLIYCTHVEAGTDGGVLESGYRLVTNPTRRCYVGDHLVVASMAWVIGVLFIVAFPIGTFVYLYRQRPTPGSRLATLESGWSFFCRSDYRAERYWFKHFNSALMLTLAWAAIQSRLNNPLYPLMVLGVSLVVFGCFIAAILHFKPYRDGKVRIERRGVTVVEL